MSIQSTINRLCKQTAVYWGNPVNNGEGGYSFDLPFEVACRWEEVNEIVAGKDGNSFSAKSVLYLTQDIQEEGVVFLGTLDDLDSAELLDPTLLENAFIIKRFDKIPALNSTTEFIRKGYLTTKNMW